MSDIPCPCCGGNGWEGSDCANIQAELETRLAAERALADQLANFARNCLETSSSTRLRRLSKAALDAWKEARK